jgi:serralysin
VFKGSQQIAQLEVDTSDGNAKVDVVIAANGRTELHLSTSADLVTGISKANLLGVADLSLVGTSGADTLTGNKGDNVIISNRGADRINGAAGEDEISGGGGYDRIFGGSGHDNLSGNHGSDEIWGGYANDRIFGGNSGDRLWGGNGHDKIWGGNGHDWLYGGNGFDTLDGGSGNDKLKGGVGSDTFVFRSGDEVILDFTDNVDQIKIERDILRDGQNSVRDLLDAGRVHNGDAVLTFDDGHSLTIDDVSNLNILVNDLTLI